jgi:hypothetical protein
VLQGVMGALSRQGTPALDRPAASLLSVPLVLSFFLLSGMRFVFTLPAELRANWVFQLSDADGRKECLAGVRKAMFAFGITPLLLSLFPVYVFLWGWSGAIFHSFYDAVLSLLLIEVLLFRFHKIPFTCSYLPGKANITGLWFVYGIGFATYAYSMATLEARILQDGWRMALGYLLGALAVMLVYLYRNRALSEGFNLVFEEQPEPAVRTLNLSIPGSW